MCSNNEPVEMVRLLFIFFFYFRYSAAVGGTNGGRTIICFNVFFSPFHEHLFHFIHIGKMKQGEFYSCFVFQSARPAVRHFVSAFGKILTFVLTQFICTTCSKPFDQKCVRICIAICRHSMCPYRCSWMWLVLDGSENIDFLCSAGEPIRKLYELAIYLSYLGMKTPTEINIEHCE